MHTYDVELTDTFGGEANYCWVRRKTVTMPELTHYGYDGGTNYAQASHFGDMVEFRPYGLLQVMFINWRDD